MCVCVCVCGRGGGREVNAGIFCSVLTVSASRPLAGANFPEVILQWVSFAMSTPVSKWPSRPPMPAASHAWKSPLLGLSSPMPLILHPHDCQFSCQPCLLIKSPYRLQNNLPKVLVWASNPWLTNSPVAPFPKGKTQAVNRLTLATGPRWYQQAHVVTALCCMESLPGVLLNPWPWRLLFLVRQQCSLFWPNFRPGRSLLMRHPQLPTLRFLGPLP